MVLKMPLVNISVLFRALIEDGEITSMRIALSGVKNVVSIGNGVIFRILLVRADLCLGKYGIPYKTKYLNY
jgi:hypothetical protein